MHDREKWNVALLQLAEFVRNLPLRPDDDDAVHYHNIITLLEDAENEDLSRFKIAADQIEGVPSAIRAQFWEHWETRHSRKNSIKPYYFHHQVRELLQYLEADLETKPS